MVRRCVCSRSLVNEEALAQGGCSAQKKKKITRTSTLTMRKEQFKSCVSCKFDKKSKYGQTFQGPSNDGAILSHTDTDSLNTPCTKI